MSWLSDIGGTLGSMGSVLGAFAPGLGQGIAGLGGFLAATDDPEALTLFPGFPFEPGGMAYGITRTRPGGVEDFNPGYGWFLGGDSFTDGPTYSSGVQPMNWRDVNPVLRAQGFIAGGERFRVDRPYWNSAPNFHQSIQGIYAALWGLDLETIGTNPIGSGPRRFLVEDDSTDLMIAFHGTEGAPERAPLKEVVLVSRAQPAASFWQEEWLTAPAPVFDSSVANLQTWDEVGGGAVQTWMQLSPMGEAHSMTTDEHHASYGYTRFPAWRNLETTESQAAFDLWETYQAIELTKYQAAAQQWYALQQQRLAQQAWNEYQAQAEAHYWQQWQESQEASAAYLEGLTQYANPLTSLPPEVTPPTQTSLSGDVDIASPPAPAPLFTDPALSEPVQTAQAAPLTVGEEEAIGIGAAAAALLIL